MPILEQNMSPNGDLSLTVPKCQISCYSAGFGFAGVQNGDQCWCGSYVGGNWASDQASCNMACTGDEETFCGAHGFLNIFEAKENHENASATTFTTTTDSISGTASDTVSATAVVSSAAANKLGVIGLTGGFWGPIIVY